MSPTLRSATWKVATIGFVLDDIQQHDRRVTAVVPNERDACSVPTSEFENEVRSVKGLCEALGRVGLHAA